jgi:hypothetical protein
MTFTITQNDTAPPIRSRLKDSGEPVNLTNVSNVFFYMENEYKEVVVSDDLTGRVNILDNTVGEVEYMFKSSETENVGRFKAEWEVLYDDGTRETFPSDGKVSIEITGGIK